MLHDYHTHTNYSDGDLMHRMLAAAENSKLDAIGIADHCNVSDREIMKEKKHSLGFNLDMTYKRRRKAINRLKDDYDVTVFDAVEIDYHPADEDAIEAFMADAGFDYIVGSVHFIDDVNVHYIEHFEALSEQQRKDAVDQYFDMLVAMIESEIVDIAAHMDVFERNPALRGFATDQHYGAVADALADSKTVPEINAGRLLDEYGQPHPSDPFFEALMEYDIDFTFGTDSHTPEQLANRIPALQQVFEDRGVSPVTLDAVV